MLAELLRSTLRAKVIEWFFTHVDERYFVRQLTKLLDVDSTNLSRELAHLTKIGVLVRQEEGRQKYYRANKACAVFAELKSLVVKTAGLADVLRDALMPLARRVAVAFVFGSLARGTEDAHSDIDVMIVGGVPFGAVVEAFGRAETALGREINPTVYPPAEFRSKARAKHHFLAEVLGQPKIFLIGGDSDIAGLVAE